MIESQRTEPGRPGARIAGAVLVVLCATAGGTAHAEDYGRASGHFSTATKQYNAKSYKRSIAALWSAYELTHDPLLYYDMAVAYEAWGKGAEAARYYRLYALEQYKGEDRTAVEKRLDWLAQKYHLALAPLPPAREAPTAVAAVETPRPEAKPAETKPEAAASKDTAPDPFAGALPTPARRVEHTSGLKIAAWVTLGAAAVLGTAGAFSLLAAHDRGEQITREQQAAATPGGPPVYYSPAVEQRFADLHGQGTMYNGLGIALVSTAAVSVAVSALLFGLDHRQRAERRVQLVPSLSPRGGGLLAAFEF